MATLTGQLYCLRGGKFLDIHLDGTVTGDVDYMFVRKGHLCADGCRQTESHGAESSGGDESPRQIEFVELGSPHLILADLGGDDGISSGQFIQFFDDILGFYNVTIILVGEWMFCLPIVDGIKPGLMTGSLSLLRLRFFSELNQLLMA